MKPRLTFAGLLASWLSSSAAGAQAWGPPPPNQAQPGQPAPPPPGAQQYPPQQYPPQPGAQQYPPAGAQQYPPSPYGYPQQPYYPPRKDVRTDLEIGVLYATSVTYGVGMGVWISSEIGIDDPGIFLIAPAALGLAAPIGVYALDQPSMESGMPAAIALGMLVGAGEGVGIAGHQFVTADEEDEWGFVGLARGMALGSTLGAVGGYALAYYEEPSPKSSAFVGSGVLWGTAVGSMFGYGASEAGVGYGKANDSASLGGLIGFNVGLVATGALSSFYYPTYGELAWMWAGAGIGAAVSLPIFLFYAQDDGPPAKRGFIFMGAATLLGIAGGAVLGQGAGDSGMSSTGRSLSLSVDYVVPAMLDDAAGVLAGGTF